MNGAVLELVRALDPELGVVAGASLLTESVAGMRPPWQWAVLVRRARNRCADPECPTCAAVWLVAAVVVGGEVCDG